MEVRNLNTLAKEMRARGKTAEAAELEKRAQAINDSGHSSDELREMYVHELARETGVKKDRNQIEDRYGKVFREWFSNGGSESREIHAAHNELRDFLAGTQTAAWTLGAQGGFTVPIDTYEEVLEAMVLTDSLLDPEVADFCRYQTPYMKPLVLDGYDLSTIQAVQVGEGSQQTAQAVPNVAGRTLRSNITYRVSLPASLEWEQDAVIPGSHDALSKIARAMGVAFARKIGVDAVLGNGTTQPLGLFNSLGPSAYQTGSGKITLTDINAIYFKVDKFYRNQPKCAWLCSDQVYQRLRNMTDNSGRPLIDIEGDREVLLDRPVYICPSLSSSGTFASLGFGALVFGDIGHFHCHMSRPMLQRSIENSINGIEKGEALWRGFVRFDSAIFDPSGGSAPPIIWAQVVA